MHRPFRKHAPQTAHLSHIRPNGCASIHVDGVDNSPSSIRGAFTNERRTLLDQIDVSIIEVLEDDV